MSKKIQWTEHEDNFIKENYGIIATDDIAKELNKTKHSIQTRAGKLGVKFIKVSEKEGCTLCKKCRRELPTNQVYFPIDKTCVSGHRSVCRECVKDGHFMSEDYVPNVIWTKEENDLLIQRYPFYTNEELINNFYTNYTEKQIYDRADRLRKQFSIDLYKTEEVVLRSYAQRGEKTSIAMTGRIFTEEQIINMSNAQKKWHSENESYWKGKTRSDENKKNCSIAGKARGAWKGDKNPRHIKPLNGEENGRWLGGITPLYFELRTQISEWKTDSIKNSNYKCILSGEVFDEIHHLYPFRKIVDEVFINIKLDTRKSVSEYTEEEFKLIVEELKILHVNYGLGVCLKKEVHKEFHDKYGYNNNTPEQFYEFAKLHYGKDLKI